MPLFRGDRNDRRRRDDLTVRVARLMEEDREARATADQDALDRVLATAWQFEKELLPQAHSRNARAAGALLDVARICLPYQVSASNWYGALASAAAACVAVNSLVHGGGLAPDKLPELGYQDLETALLKLRSRLYGLPEIVAYAAHRASNPLAAVGSIETLTSVVFELRMAAYTMHWIEQRETAGMVGYAELGGHVQRLERIGATQHRASSGKTRSDAIRATEESWLAQEMALPARDDPLEQFFLTTPGAHAARAAAAAGRTVVYVLTGPGDKGGVAVRVGPGGEYGWHAASTSLPALQTPAVRARLDEIRDRFKHVIAAGRQLGLADHIQSLLEWTGVSTWRSILDAWPDLATTPLAIIPIGNVALLPLYTATVNGAPACTQMNLTMAPSARALHFAAALPTAAIRGQVVVAADPWHGENRLELVDEEARTIAAVHGVKEIVYGSETSSSGNSTVMRAFQGPPPAPHSGISPKLKALLHEASLVHLACHGTAMGPSLLLGNNVILLHELVGGDATDLTTTLRGRPVVILSACEVGGFIAADAPGEHFGFPAGLLAMGARAVVGALWPVPDSHRTIEFMRDFHQRLLRKPSSAAFPEAVLAAKRRGMPLTVWGSFAHFGL